MAAAIATATSSGSPANRINALTEGEAVRFVLVGTSALRAAERTSVLPSPSEGARELAAALRAAVERACAGGPVGVLVSGGLDSSVIAALAVQAVGPEQVLLCQASGSYATSTESSLCHELSDHLGCELLEIDEPQEWWPALVEVNRGSRFPVGGAFVGVFQSIGRSLRGRGIARVLSGDGADDLFATDQLEIADLLRAVHPFRAWRTAASIGMWLGESPRRVFINNGLVPLLLQRSRWGVRYASRRVFDATLATSPFEPTAGLRETIAEISEEITRSWVIPNSRSGGFAHDSRRRATIDAEEATYDLASVTRLTPYLDPHVVDCGLSLAPAAAGGYIGARDKEALRRAFADLLPARIRWHRKTGQPDVVARAVAASESKVAEAFDLVREATGGVITLTRNLHRHDTVPPEMQQAWLRGLYLAAWIEAHA